MLGREEIRKLKEDYPEGTQIRLLRMNGEEQMPSGMQGTVRHVDDIGQIGRASCRERVFGLV